MLPLLCTTTHGSAKDDHSCGRRGRRRRRRWRLERGDAALSASCPPRARANARALESATSPVRPKCGLRRAARARSRAASQARAVEMSAVCLGRSRVPSRCSTGGTCAGATALRFALYGQNMMGSCLNQPPCPRDTVCSGRVGSETLRVTSSRTVPNALTGSFDSEAACSKVRGVGRGNRPGRLEGYL